MSLIKNNGYIIKYYGSYYPHKSNTVSLILEYCTYGSAVDLMISMNRTINEIEVSTIIQIILKGLIYIHKINLIHQYIKGSNILLSEDGYAKLDETDDDYRTSKKGSPYWMSPQVALNEKYKQKMCVVVKPGKFMGKKQLIPPKS